MNITPKGSIQPIPIAEEKSEGLALFQERNNLHESINGFKVYINQYAWDAFLNHGNNVYQQTKHEAQGIFLGKYYRDNYGEFVVATEFCEGKGESSHAYVGMSEECVAEISQKCAAEKLLMLIWVHTHPNFGVFYSGTDVNCLKTNFYMSFQSGIVVDIIRKESKGFKVKNDKVDEFTGYYIYHLAEKKLSKPYAISFETKNEALKKNENPKTPEFPIKQILSEFQSIKKELAEIKSIVNKQSEQPKPQKQVDSVKNYLEEHFSSIKQQLNQQKNYSKDFEHLISVQSKFKKYLFKFLIGLSILFGLGAIAFIYFFIKLFINH